jgi:phosphatidate cytidylyltransferase
MPRNPFANPLFEPTLLRIALLIGVAALIIITVERKNLARWRESVLFQRVASWAVMAPVFTISVFTGGVAALFLIGLMSFQGLTEFGRLVRLERPYRAAVIAYCWAGLLVIGTWGSRFFLFLPLGFFAVATLIPLVRLSTRPRESGNELFQASASMLGYLWIGLSLSFFVLIARSEPNPAAVLLLIGFSVALSDVLAFTVGKLAGGPRLSPGVSPNKTWAGVAGNLAGAYLAFWLMEFAIPVEWSAVTRWVLPLIIGLAAVWGDLVESLVKRGFGQKDAGDVLPGFGGLLDRIDSLLLAMPLAYYGIQVAEYFAH